jgi:transposase
MVTAANVNDTTMFQAVVADIPPIRTPAGRRRTRPARSTPTRAMTAEPTGLPTPAREAVKAFAASTGGGLRLCFLPGYRPELNPDEWVWKHVKHDRIGRAGVTSPDDLKAKALAALHRLQRLPHLVRSFFRDPNLRYITT